MAPRPGGEADKLGNRYELAWVVRHALYCIQDDRRSLKAEDDDPELSNGSEFTFVDRSTIEVHQLKRQNGDTSVWTIKALARLKVFGAAAAHVRAGRRFHFVSLIPCGSLAELAERARRSADLDNFTKNWLQNKKLRSDFDELAAKGILGSPSDAWTTLRGMWFAVQGERDVQQVNTMLAELLLEGATGGLMSLALGEIILTNLGRKLTRVELLEELALRDIRLRAAASRTSTVEQVRSVTNGWQATVQLDLLRPPIERAESTQLVDVLANDRLALVVGTAGGGKSVVLEQTVASLESAGAAVMAFRLDRLSPFASTTELGRQLGLDTSPAAALAVAADGRDAYLVIDQVDAVSLASGRMPESFDVVIDLIGEALSVAGVKVLLACREFDVDNDHRIRALAARDDMAKVKVGALPIDEVQQAITTMGLDPKAVSAAQLELLRTPLHLVLLQTIASQSDALAFHSRGSLFEAFWERKRQATRARRQDVRFNDVVARIANAASERQTLSVPVEILDEGDLIEDAKVLVSEHVLARDGGRIAFFHEAFFDYAFARHWVSRSESLVDFLCRDEQELFRRAQVRQILQHLYEREYDRFLGETEAALTSPDIRFHIKETVIVVLANILDPTTREADLALRVAATKPRYEDRLWQQLRRPQWFQVFHANGWLGRWLDSDDEELRNRAVAFMGSAVNEHGDAVAALLAARRDSPNYLDWLRWVTRFADVHASRALFDLTLAAVRAGGFDASEHELWLSTHELAKHEPLWAIELLQARVVDHAEALRVDDNDKVAILSLHEYSLTELVRDAASAEPLVFVQVIVPYLRAVMAATSSPPYIEGGWRRDNHFNFRFPDSDLDERELDDALFAAGGRALAALAETAPDEVRPILEDLVDDEHEAAQYLLYRALTAAGATFTDWASQLLLEGGRRLDCGYTSDGFWVARELVQAIAPHISDDVHGQFEAMFRDLRMGWESRPYTGRTAFTFLSALDETRLSPVGVRRLNEYRRKFNQETPPPPEGITGGAIGSPITPAAASKMSDEHWLKAMAKYDSDRSDFRTLTGGARELSHVLREQVKEDPARFARLALRITRDLNPAYGDGVLMGFGDAIVSEDDRPLIYEAIRHLASLGHADYDRWLGTALRSQYKDAPLDLVQLILERTLNSPDPLDSSPVFVRDKGSGRQALDLRQNGINTGRGSLAEALGDLLVYDADGERTELVRPHLNAMATDPVLYVRACVAHTIAASLRHARPAAIEAFEQLIQADDVLLASDLVQGLMLYVGNVNPEVIDPVIQRMLHSVDEEARKTGGFIAAFAGLEWNRPEVVAQALTGDAHVRAGLAEVCAARVDRTSSTDLATSTLRTLMHDGDEEVRKAVARLAGHLRNQHLRPFADLLSALIDSPSYEQATPQLLITLQHASDRVDDLVLTAAQRFVRVFGDDAADIRTAAAGDARYISELVVRGLAQTRDREHRGSLLDVLDLLLELGVYGIGEAIAETERF